MNIGFVSLFGEDGTIHACDTCDYCDNCDQCDSCDCDNTP